jgi:hypothetical protein
MLQRSSFGTYKSTYTPINEEKYVGDQDPICRSSWERAFCKWCDFNKNVVHWSSETVVIPYISKVDKKLHRYYVDFVVEFVDSKVVLFEIKPFKETQPPKVRKRTKRFLYEMKTYATNTSKWKAASEFAKRKGVSFQILTEHELRKLGIKI